MDGDAHHLHASGAPGLSLWHDTLEPGDDGSPRDPLGGDRDADVAIVGAGFTGLWTAYYLGRADPTLRIVVLERATAGDGASGRNGGWCVGDQGATLPALERSGGSGGAARMVHAVQGAVDEVGAVVEAEAIDCGFAKGGAVYLASTPTELGRWRKKARVYSEHGLADAYEVWDAATTEQVVRARGIVGSLHTDHAAAVHPARLARGVARAAERGGVSIYERTAVEAIEQGRVRTARGTVRAEVTVRATEAYTPSLEGEHRTILPFGNHMIATDPIDDGTWAEIGLAGRELFEDGRNMLGYGQRTADGRIAWGGLSAWYWWGSRLPSGPMQSEQAERRLRDRLVELFPALSGIGLSHHWGGILGVPRDLRPSVGLDRSSGRAWAGGYFGAGVAIANLAGRTLADLITGRDTDLTTLPWVDHRSRRWEPEPLRWLGVHAATTAAHAADRFDGRHRRP
jgi:glycine/D-amino acid oxidase-like deaminating enzyme